MKILKSIIFVGIVTSFLGCNGRLDRLNPVIEQRVIDYANILTDSERDSLFQIINEIRSTIGPHLGIVIVDSLSGVTIDQFAHDTFEEIHLGRIAYKDGILIAVSMKERLIRIETGEGIIPIISDEEAKLINSTIIAPQFREKNYFGGLLAALNFIKNELEANKLYLNRLNKG